MIFEDESFDELAVKLERWYDVKIHFVDSGIRNYKFTGSFNKETVNQAMEALKLSSQKSYEYEIVFRGYLFDGKPRTHHKPTNPKALCRQDKEKPKARQSARPSAVRGSIMLTANKHHPRTPLALSKEANRTDCKK